MDKQNTRAACPNDKNEIKFSFDLLMFNNIS